MSTINTFRVALGGVPQTGGTPGYQYLEAVDAAATEFNLWVIAQDGTPRPLQTGTSQEAPTNGDGLRALDDIASLSAISLNDREDADRISVGGVEGGGDTFLIIEGDGSSLIDGGIYIAFDDNPSGDTWYAMREGVDPSRIKASWYGLVPNMPQGEGDAAFARFLDGLDNENAPGLDRTGCLDVGNYDLFETHALARNIGIQGVGQSNTIITYRGTRQPLFVPLGVRVEDEVNVKPFNVKFYDMSITTDHSPQRRNTVSSASSGTGGVVRLTMSTDHGLSTGEHIWVTALQGCFSDPSTENGLHQVTVVSDTVIDLDGTVFAGPLTGSGEWYVSRNNHLLENIVSSTGAVGGEIRLTVTNHGMSDGEWIVVGPRFSVEPDVANGAWQVSVVDANTVDLVQSWHDGTPYVPPTGRLDYVHTGTVAFLQASTQDWTKERISFGSNSRTFDLASSLKCGRRFPAPSFVGDRIRFGIWRGDTTLDTETNCNYGGGGLYGIVHMGTGGPTAGFANMHGYYGTPFLTNQFGQGLTIRRGVASTFIGAKASTCYGNGIELWGSFNTFDGLTVVESTRGGGFVFQEGSVGNTAPNIESGGSNRLGDIIDNSEENRFSQINGLTSNRGLVLRQDGDTRGRSGSLKRTDTYGYAQTGLDDTWTPLIGSETHFTVKTGSVAAAGGTELVGWIRPPEGTDIKFLSSSLYRTSNGTVVANTSLEVLDGTTVVFAHSGESSEGGIDAPIGEYLNAGNRRLQIRVINNSGGSFEFVGNLALAYVRT